VLSEKFCGEGVPDWAVYTGSKHTVVMFSVLREGNYLCDHKLRAAKYCV